MATHTEQRDASLVDQVIKQLGCQFECFEHIAQLVQLGDRFLVSPAVLFQRSFGDCILCTQFFKAQARLFRIRARGGLFVIGNTADSIIIVTVGAAAVVIRRCIITAVCSGRRRYRVIINFQVTGNNVCEAALFGGHQVVFSENVINGAREAGH